MTKADKILEKMRNNPTNWQIADLEGVSKRLGISIRQGKGSHVSFSHPSSIDILTIPAHRPVKSIYVKKLLGLIDALVLKEEKI
ncbi:MAG: type II toxin-antitoxin system HicA family toxin [Gammaproteobacteria bacterium]|nr:type II toxin-antitoxin system HicA family toxin [Gammaproteobacteria bacterium]